MPHNALVCGSSALAATVMRSLSSQFDSVRVALLLQRVIPERPELKKPTAGQIGRHGVQLDFNDCILSSVGEGKRARGGSMGSDWERGPSPGRSSEGEPQSRDEGLVAIGGV